MNEEDINQKLNSVEFRRFYRQEVYKEVAKINEEYKKIEREVKVSRYFDIIPTIVVLLCVSLSFHSIPRIILSIILFPLLCVFLVSSLLILFIKSAPVSYENFDKEKAIKSAVLNKMLSLLGNFEYISYDWQEKKELAESLMESKLFNGFTNITHNVSVDDHFRGIYKNTRIRLYEIIVRREEESPLNLIYIRMPYKKDFRGFTLIRTTPYLKDFGEKINLEDSMFKKYFNVKGSNQIESRYLLTTGLMSRLLKYRLRRIFPEIDILFESKEVHILLTTDKKWFEIPANCISERAVKKVVLELLGLFEIIDELKLNQDIGL